MNHRINALLALEESIGLIVEEKLAQINENISCVAVCVGAHNEAKLTVNTNHCFSLHGRLFSQDNEWHYSYGDDKEKPTYVGNFIDQPLNQLFNQYAGIKCEGRV